MKLVLIWRINVNWDEFFYLSHVYEYIRGDLSRVFQLVHVHVFSWLPAVGTGEIDQVVVGRLVMWVCLALTVIMIYRLARFSTSSTAAWFAPLTFLAMSPVLRHGAAFRADSLLVPLALLSLIWVASPRAGEHRILLAGSLLGASLAISLKAILLAPLIVALIVTAGDGTGDDWKLRTRTALLSLVKLGAAAGVVAVTMLYLHWLTLSSPDSGSIATDAVNAAQKTMFDVPLLPRWDYLKQTLETDWLSWLLIAGGLAVALVRSRRTAIFALSLTPLLFYRNAFPYYYIVMLAPVAVLASVAVDGLFDLGRRGSSDSAWLPIAASVPLIFQAAVNLDEFRFDEQEIQRATVDAVHEIFPEPVPYIDHSGMVASFPKVNFFMSSWGVETYRDRGKGFVRQAIDTHRPPMLLANASVLMVGSSSYENLLDEDRRLIEQFYVPYWGAINVAGTIVDLESSDEVTVELPFPGRYRLETEQEVVVDGSVLTNGSVKEIPESADHQFVTLRRIGTEPVTVRLVWADAQPPPAGFVPRFASLYTGL